MLSSERLCLTQNKFNPQKAEGEPSNRDPHQPFCCHALPELVLPGERVSCRYGDPGFMFCNGSGDALLHAGHDYLVFHRGFTPLLQIVEALR